MKRLRISLAQKCQLLFGLAVLVIIITALTVAWLRMDALVRQVQLERARELAQACKDGRIPVSRPGVGDTRFRLFDILPRVGNDNPQLPPTPEQSTISLLKEEEWSQLVESGEDPFLAGAVRSFLEPEQSRNEAFTQVVAPDGLRYSRYAVAIRKSDEAAMFPSDLGRFAPEVATTFHADPLRYVLVLQLPAEEAARQLLVNRIVLIAAGLLAGLLAIGAFWYITTRLILSPVRVLRETTEKVSEGNLDIRSAIHTGDEFEQLSDTFNDMLASLRTNQDKLRTINKSLDLKLGELAETNVALYEANRIKTDFLANVSHELRTPLNSIIGFAEVLQETLRGRTGPVDEKRKRYTHNIITSSRQLLDLINDLLDLAKIEAGRIDVNVAPLSIADACEGLVNLIRPQAEKKQITLKLQVQPGIPMVHTDAGKLQQILFNFLSNAIKFTPVGGRVTLAASRLTTSPAHAATTGSEHDIEDDSLQPAPANHDQIQIRVTDTGPGIALEDQQRIFEKFTQLENPTTREHPGSGLGLTISKDLAAILQGRIDVDSDPGRGAAFILTIPLRLTAQSLPLMPDLTTPSPTAPSPSTTTPPPPNAAQEPDDLTAGLDLPDTYSPLMPASSTSSSPRTPMPARPQNTPSSPRLSDPRINPAENHAENHGEQNTHQPIAPDSDREHTPDKHDD